MAEPEKAEKVGDFIEAIEFRGSRRVPQDTLRAMIFSKKGDRVDDDALRRDFMALWNTGRFDDIRLEIEPGKKGQIVRFMLLERQIVRTIKYEGVKSITVSEIMDRFKERHVGLTVESQYEPNRVQRAKVVLQEYLAERGRQFAEVVPEVTQIPPSSLAITFRVNEGPKVKVGNIDIQGNKVYPDRVVIRAMKNLRPIGIPKSIYLENIFSKAYDLTKLEQDKDMIRNFYQERGYFQAKALDQTVKIRESGGGGFRIPLLYPNSIGKAADIGIPVEEGRLYRLNKLSFTGMKLFRTPDVLGQQIFQMKPGDIFSTAKLRKGLEDLRKLYGQFGYIDFVPEPDFDIRPGSDKVDLILNLDEGKQFFIRRIDFSGNTTTRDKVIRRELLLDEGDMYSTRMWELSILRLNQLGYFEALKENEAADIKRDNKTNTVDITLKVKERGKNTIGMQGGVSAISGTFVGLNYATNNFLGLGETLSVDTQLGDRQQAVTFGFTEPYFLERPLQTGFTVYVSRFDYNQARELSLMSGRNLIGLFKAMGDQNTLNYVSNGRGFTVFASYPLKRSFARVGLTYGLDRSDINPENNASTTYFQYVNFQGLSGPNSLTGIKTSKLVPSFSYNTVNHPMTPTAGKSIFASIEFAGSVLGGNVNMIRPTITGTYYRKGLHQGHVIAMRGLASFMTGYGGKIAPTYSRFYMGGEQDIRGFETWAVGPIGFVPNTTQSTILNSDGTPRLQKYVNENGVVSYQPVTLKVPYYQIIFPGGDTQLLSNLEYRIPIAGPVTAALFFDIGTNRISRNSQLTLSGDRFDELTGTFPQANFERNVKIIESTQKVRQSLGIEFQVIMPVVNAPFRLYWAFNPRVVREYMLPPTVLDRSLFPNQASYLQAIASYGSPIPFWERRSLWRFTIGRTF